MGGYRGCLGLLHNRRGGRRAVARVDRGPLKVEEPAVRERRGLGLYSGPAGWCFQFRYGTENRPSL